MTGERIAPWDSYWSGDPVAPDAADQRWLAHYWEQAFEHELDGLARARAVDLACGNGAVTAALLAVAARRGTPVDCTGVDASPAAVDALTRRFPAVTGVVADAVDVPLESGTFTLVASQFGLEYAGAAAFAEAARLVASPGVMITVVHLADGALFADCRNGLEATRAFADTHFVTRARQAFEAGYAVIAGRGPVGVFERRQRRLKPAIDAAAQVIERYGQDVAGSRLAQAFAGIERMYRRMRHYDGNEVAQWIDAVDAELRAYTARMQSMLTAAVDDAGEAQIVARVTAAGLVLDRATRLRLTPESPPFARELVFRRPAAAG